MDRSPKWADASLTGAWNRLTASSSGWCHLRRENLWGTEGSAALTAACTGPFISQSKSSFSVNKRRDGRDRGMRSCLGTCGALGWSLSQPLPLLPLCQSHGGGAGVRGGGGRPVALALGWRVQPHQGSERKEPGGPQWGEPRQSGGAGPTGLAPYPFPYCLSRGRWGAWQWWVNRTIGRGSRGLACWGRMAAQPASTAVAPPEPRSEQ